MGMPSTLISPTSPSPSDNMYWTRRAARQRRLAIAKVVLLMTAAVLLFTPKVDLTSFGEMTGFAPFITSAVADDLPATDP
jgi:hypothetical protein